MSDNLHDLGAAVVFDADNMVVGQHVMMEGHLFVVSKIEDERVFLQPVVGAALLAHRIKKYRLWLAGLTTLVITALYFYITKGH